MIKIALVDDEKLFAKKLIEQIADWAKKNNCEINVDYFSSANDFMERFSKRSVWDALFFDIDMPEINGLDLAKSVRSKDEKIPITFISGYPLFSTDGYEVNACRFLVKNTANFDKKFSECMNYIISFVNTAGNSSLCVKMSQNTISISYKDILYFESQLHNIKMVTISDTYRYRKNIADLLGELPTYFIQTARSYIVNLTCVKTVHADSVELYNGEKIQLTKTYKQKVLSAFMGRT